MRVRSWRSSKSDSNAIDGDGAPWIEKVCPEGQEDRVRLALTGPAEDNVQIRVLFVESEWPVIKARVDAAFAGEDPNRTEFYEERQKT